MARVQDDSDDSESKEATMSNSVAQAGRVVKALVDSLEPKEFLELLNHKVRRLAVAAEQVAQCGSVP